MLENSVLLKGHGFTRAVNCFILNAALQAAEKLPFLPFGGSRGLQPPE